LLGPWRALDCTAGQTNGFCYEYDTGINCGHTF
jgi:hypothetical protein